MEHRKRVKMVLEYSNKYQTEVKGYDDIYGKGKSAEAVGALDASAKYLSCMGLFYWSLGILTVTRMVTQGLGYSGRTVFSGVAFVGTFGYTAICFADQAAWIAACCYSVPTCLWCMKKSIAKLKRTK